MNEELSYEKIKGITRRILTSLRDIKKYVPEMLSEKGMSALDAYNLISWATVSSQTKAMLRDNLERVIVSYESYSQQEAYGIKLNSEIVNEIRSFVNQYMY